MPRKQTTKETPDLAPLPSAEHLVIQDLTERVGRAYGEVAIWKARAALAEMALTRAADAE